MVNSYYTLFLLISAIETRRYLKWSIFENYESLFHSRYIPPVSIFVPSYNEERTIAESVKSLFALNYPNFEIIVINDGSKDKTLDVLMKTFNLKLTDKLCRQSIPTKSIRGIYSSEMHSNLTVIDKENGGKADALNCGINVAKHPYFCAIDSDVVIERDALLKIVQPVSQDPEKVVASSGIVRIANGCVIENGQLIEIRLPKNSLAVFQILEYFRGFLAGRTALSSLNSLLIISGAFGLFNRELVKEVGGYLADTVGEDMELVVRLHHYLRKNKRKYKIVFIGTPMCWTEVPEETKQLARQRNRWHRGLMDSLWRHKQMFLNPFYGIVGIIGMPFFVFAEALSPLIEGAGYILIIIQFLMGAMNKDFFILFLGVTVLYGILLSLSIVLVEELGFHRYKRWQDLVRLMLHSILENLGYRQFHVLWRIQGFIDFLRKKKSWGEQVRKGFAAKPTPQETFYNIT